MKSLIVLGLLCITLNQSNAFFCPTGFEQFPQEESCWNINTQVETYSGAVRQCSLYKIQSQPNIQPSVVKIQGAMENALVYVTLAKSAVAQTAPYIGIEKTADGRWVYSDGSTLVYNNWSPGHPLNTTTAQCVVMDPPTGMWNSTDCSTSRPYFCSYKKECNDGWIYFPPTGSCYFLQDFAFDTYGKWLTWTWSSADTACQQKGGRTTSIHSTQENNFLLDWATSNVSNLNGVFNGNPCTASYVWMGLYGTGALGNPSSWRDGTPVDFTAVATQSSYYYWAMVNDPSCKLRGWSAISTSSTAYNSARYFCKAASKSRLALEKANMA